MRDYNVITLMSMVEVFEAKIRKVGNAEGIIIPNDVLKKIGAVTGDVIKLAVPVEESMKIKALKEMAGIDKGAKPFERDRRDI